MSSCCARRTDRADHLLFLDGHAAGVIEAKREGETLVGVEHQSAKYVDGPARRARAGGRGRARVRLGGLYGTIGETVASGGDRMPHVAQTGDPVVPKKAGNKCVWLH